MAAVREVETLVADREVGDPFAAHGERQRQPVVEARVLDAGGGDAALGVGQENVAGLAAPSLNQSERERRGASGAA